ncbi:MAG: RES family NAD+ phosphorylase [Bryobacteraceae bacterium]
MRVYRILRRAYSKTPLDGEGAYRFGGRWSSPGIRVAYVSEHLSLAMLEYLVHIEPGDLPKDLVVAAAEIPGGIPRASVNPSELPPNWRQTPPPPAIAALGDAFVRRGRAAILGVPSALAPIESNWLINPAHPAFSRIRLLPAETFQYDFRILRPR